MKTTKTLVVSESEVKEAYINYLVNKYTSDTEMLKSLLKGEIALPKLSFPEFVAEAADEGIYNELGIKEKYDYIVVADGLTENHGCVNSEDKLTILFDLGNVDPKEL